VATVHRTVRSEKNKILHPRKRLKIVEKCAAVRKKKAALPPFILPQYPLSHLTIANKIRFFLV